MKKILISLGSVITLGLPAVVSAANPNLDSYLGTAIGQGTTLLRYTLTFLISLAVIWFIYNVVRYSMSEEDEGKAKAKSQMIWGIIAIAVIVSVWSVVALLQNAFGIGGNTANDFQFDQMIPGGSSQTQSSALPSNPAYRLAPTPTLNLGTGQGDY